MVKLLLLSLALLLSQCNGTGSSQSAESVSGQVQETSVQQEVDSLTTSQEEQSKQVPVQQGITGKVLWVAGNQMPSPDAPPSKGRGVQRTLYIYELTNASQATTTEGVFHTNIQTNLVAQVVTDANGNFAVDLKPGKYSLFSKEEKGHYANLFDGENNINPVEVGPGKVTTIEFLINYQASY